MTTAALTADARNRALRTFLQGLGTDVLAAVVLLVLPVFTNAQGWQDIDWKILGFLLAKTVVVTGLSYVMRTWLDKRTDALLPPPTPEPKDDAGFGAVELLVAVLVVVVLVLLILRLA